MRKGAPVLADNNKAVIIYGGAGRGQRVMVYKDFEIIKQKNGKYAIIAGGYIIAFGRSVEACKDYIDDELIYNE